MLTGAGELWGIAPGFEGAIRHGARGGGERPVRSARGLAVLRIIGALWKYGTCGTREIRHEIEALASDDAIARVVMVFDSPGGMVAGTDDLAQAVHELAKRKPVIAYCEDLCASAAYWVASQAREVYANRSALVGSIGVYSIVYDASGALESEGIKVHLLKSSEFKGAGVPGVPVEDKHLADWQRIIDDTHSQFVAAVKRARPGVDSKSFDGRVHHAAQARKLGLIDGVKGLDEVLAKGTDTASASASATSITTYVAQAVQKVSATERVNALIAEGVGRGETRAHVIGALAQTHPELMRAWCDEKTAATHARKGRR